jgi:hypothetical protein
MKKFRNMVCLAILAASLVFPTTALASDGRVPLLDDKVIVGGTYTLESGEVLEGSLIVIGGVVNLEPDSVVDGDILVFGGNVTVEGRIRQNLVAVGGVVVLTENAEVFGDLIAPATVVRRDANAVVYGQIIADTEGLDIEIPEISQIPDIENIQPGPQIAPPTIIDSYLTSVSAVLRPITNFVWALVRAFALAAVAVLVLLFLPKHTDRVSTVVQENPVSAGGLGILTVILSVPTMVVTAISIILIPATILIAIGLILGGFFGVVAVGSEIGRRMSDGFGYAWKKPMQTAVGTFSIAFLMSIFQLAHLDWLSSLLMIVIAGIGLGSVMMTRFGTREYRPAGAAAPSIGADAVEQAAAQAEAEIESEVEPETSSEGSDQEPAEDK